MYQFVSNLMVESGAWMLGSAAGNAVVQQMIPELQRDWDENVNHKSSLRQKIFLLTPQIFLVGTCLYLYLEAPELCAVFFKKHHVIALNLFQGFLVSTTLRLGDYVIKKANRNHTPNQDIRKKSIWMLSLVTTTILVVGTIWRCSYEKILFAQIITDRTIQHLYDFNPKKGDDVTIILIESRAIKTVEAAQKRYEEKKTHVAEFVTQRSQLVAQYSKQHLTDATEAIHKKMRQIKPKTDLSTPSHKTDPSTPSPKTDPSTPSPTTSPSTPSPTPSIPLQ